MNFIILGAPNVLGSCKITIVKNVEMGGNCMLEKYLTKIKLSKHINYLTNIC
jgi:hypothetical protein